jgi:hypothetical protein
MLKTKKFFLSRKSKCRIKAYTLMILKFLNEDGSLEKWNIPEKGKLMEDLNSDIKQVEERIGDIEKELVEYADIEF